MSIDPSTQFPGQIAVPSAAYPLGSAQDITTPGDGTGTPWEKVLINDIWGVLQKLLDAAGITADGNPDTVLASQYYEGLIALLGRSAPLVFANTTTLAAGTTVGGDTAVFVIGQALKIQVTGGLVRNFVVVAASTSPNIALTGGLYAEEVYISAAVSGSFAAEVQTPFADVLSAKTWEYSKVGDIVTLNIPTGHVVQSTANDFFEVSPPTSTGVWPAAILPSSDRYIPLLVSPEGASADLRMGFLIFGSGVSSNMVGSISDASGTMAASGWGFNSVTSKGILGQTFSYSVS